MCGIVGVITKYKNGFTSKQIDIFNTLLYIDALRGEDSTGAFCVSNLGNVDIVKEASTSAIAMSNSDYNTFTTKAIRNGWALVGHNRKATKGDISDANAHPFWVEDKLVLVHNGTMYGDHKQHAKVDVDSHAIAHLIAEKDTLEEALGEFHAAYALVWYDVKQKALNFLRNSQRPLHYLETATEIIYASEKEMIEFVKDRESLTTKSPIHLLKEMTLVSAYLQEDCTFTETVKTIVPKVRAGVSAGTFSGYEGEWEWEGSRMYGNGRYNWAKHYGLDDDEDDPRVASLVNTSVDTNDSQYSEVVIDLPTQSTKHEVAQVPTYPWTKFHTLKEFEELKKQYENAHISVECMDYLSTDDASDMVYMIGRSNDANKLCIVFPVNKRLADHISHPESPSNKDNKPSMFNVKVDVMRWSLKNNPLGIISFTAKDALLTLGGHTVQ
jgi:hypothetical protein